jgi:hypothetical protein
MAFAMAMGAVALFGMASNVAMSGRDAGKNADSLRKQIKDTKAQTADLNAKWDSAIKTTVALDATTKQEIIYLLDQMAQTAAKSRVAKREFSEQYRKIQMAGVSFIIIVFFLLLLKWTGILDAADELIFAPFQKKKS